MPDDETPAAVLFADIGGSTRLYDTLGDVHGHRVTAGCLDRISEEIRRNGGRVIKTIGDEVMSTFPAASQAVEAACGIQHAVAAADAQSEIPLSVHVGLHYGLVLPEDGDVFGDTVNVASRMVGLASAGEILTTRETVEAMTPELRAQARKIDHFSVKGKRAELDIFQFTWQTANLTQLNELPEFDELTSRLLLSLGDQRFVLDSQQTSCTIGRSPDCDIVFGDIRASRDHAKVEVRRGKFVLSDHSSNGTIVRTPDAELISLHREDMVLPRAGSIGIGPSSDDCQSIAFCIEA